jgi:hypothetical protein
MSELINDAINKIRASVRKTSNLTDDLIFGLVCYKYFYNDGRFDKMDFENSFTDGPNDGVVC